MITASVDKTLMFILNQIFLGSVHVELLVARASCACDLGLLVFEVILGLLTVFLCLLDGLSVLVPEFFLDVLDLFGPFLLV